MRWYRVPNLKKVFFTFLLVGVSLSLKSQTTPAFVGLSMASGEVVERSSNNGFYDDLGKISLYSLYADVGVDASSIFSWGDAFDNPKVGLTLLGNSYSSPSIDYALGLLAFISKEYYLFNSPLFLHYHVGWGITYTGNTYDRESNNTNESVSTKLNASTDLRAGLGIRLSESWKLYGGGALLHSSNMGLKKPNFGINQYSLVGGLSYGFETMSFGDKPVPKEIPRQEFLVMGHVALRQIAFQDPYIVVGDLNVEYNRMLIRAIRAGVGAALMEDGIAYEYKKYFKSSEGNSYEPLTLGETLSFGTHLNLEICFNRLSLVGQIGYYWWHPYREIKKSPNLPEEYAVYMDYYNEHYIYNRIGYRYRLGSGLMISLIGKTQLFKIQFTELGIGYSF